MHIREIQLSKKFKIQATKAIIAICIFAITYLIILSLASLLTVLCIGAGVLFIITNPTPIIIILGLGIASLGVFILLFLLKFIIKSHKFDRSHLILIDEIQEPKLFNLIKDIAVEVDTKFPKKVYVSSDINAAVFYDSSFWSMFFPIKKNLVIGLGLVNILTQEELKAIISHEFGHFSQKSMKIGSYVYNVNQIIFNMLYDNGAYDRFIQKWGDASGIFTIFVAIAFITNKGIQWILRKLYEVVNIHYMGLSREMEFHADEIAATVIGPLPLKKSLLRLDWVENSLDNILNFYDKKIPENIKSQNVYKDQSEVIHVFTEMFNLSVTCKLPDITLNHLNKFNKSKLVIIDQWASHPRLEDRIDRLDKIAYVNVNKNDALANELFSDINRLQEQITQNIFKEINYEGNPLVITSDIFIEEYKKELFSDSFSKIYNRYYDHKNPINFDLAECSTINSTVIFEELFDDDKIDLVYFSIALQNDLQVLNNISENPTSIKTFDYDGVRYKKKEAKELAEELKVQLEDVNQKIKANDINIYCFFKKIESEQNVPKKLERMYNEFLEYDNAFESKYDIYTELINELQFVSVTTPIEQIESNFIEIKSLEDSLKQEIQLILSEKNYEKEVNDEIRSNLLNYTSKPLDYFFGNSYFDDNLNILYMALDTYSKLLSKRYFSMKIDLLAYQEVLMNNQLTSFTDN